MGPQLGTYHFAPEVETVRKGFESGQLATLNAEEAEVWWAAANRAEADGTYLWASPVHCAIGKKR